MKIFIFFSVTVTIVRLGCNCLSGTKKSILFVLNSSDEEKNVLSSWKGVSNDKLIDEICQHDIFSVMLYSHKRNIKLILFISNYHYSWSVWSISDEEKMF
jgi:hypothetical protein